VQLLSLIIAMWGGGGKLTGQAADAARAAGWEKISQKGGGDGLQNTYIITRHEEKFDIWYEGVV
jgi:hypothetical protein